MPGPAPKYPWDAIYAEWSLGLLTNTALAAKYGCSEAAIRKRSLTQNWRRDIGTIVSQETKKLLDHETVKNGARVVPTNSPNRTINPDGSPATKSIDGVEAIWGRGAIVRHGPVLTAIIQEIAAIRVQVVRTHRDAADKYRRIVDRYRDLIEDYLLGDDEKRGAAAKLLFVTEGDSLVRIVKTLGEAISMIQKLDRENFGIDNAPRQPEIDPDALPQDGETDDIDFSKLSLDDLKALEKLSDALVNKGEPATPEETPAPDQPPGEQQQAA